jgi:hypothetical protein
MQKLHLPHKELNFFLATKREEHWFIQLLSHTGPALAFNGEIGSLVLPLKAQRGKSLQKLK